MNKSLLLFLILLSVSFSENSFGSSIIEVERTWMINCPIDRCSMDFNGMVAVNNSNQRVILIETEPEMDIIGDEEIHVLYADDVGKGTTTLKTTVLLEIDYNTGLGSDFPLIPQEVNSTELTECNEAIALRAGNLADNVSILRTIRNNVEWVYDNIGYDISYFGITGDAKTVFAERRGVCVEYSHLLISMLNSLGIETRYVNGYVLSDAWQPHAWAEAYIPEYGWLPIDPTFNQAGILDSSHVIISYGTDQQSVYDIVTSETSNLTLDSSTDISSYSPIEDPKGLGISISFDNSTYIAKVEVTNNRNEYVFATYHFSSPEKYWETDSELLLMEPFETVEKEYRVNYGALPEGYIYTIPVRASVNGAKATKQIVIRKSEVKEDIEDNICLFALILALLPVILWSREIS